MQSAFWITLLLILAMFVDSSQGKKKCQCPKISSGDCRIPSGCRCPLVRSLCKAKPKTTLVGKRNAGEPLSQLDFLTVNRHLREAEALMERIQNQDIYTSRGQRSRLRRWKTND